MQTYIINLSVSKKTGAFKIRGAYNGSTFADGISVMRPGELTFSIVKELVDDIITVSEKEIADVVLYLLKNQKIMAKGVAATSTAVLLSKKYIPKKMRM